MRRWLKRLAVLGVVAALTGLAIQRRGRSRFDPTRPAHEWGTTSLTIDD